MNHTLETLTIGEIVVQDFRTASIFKQHGIDFCCGGKKSISETCTETGSNKTELLNDLSALLSEPGSAPMDFKSWNPDFLCDYIVNTHHKFVIKTLPELVVYTDKIARVHGANHPELLQVAQLFAEINRELLQHLKNEEEVLFPAIKEALTSPSASVRATIKSEITRMDAEHEFAGGSMDTINKITNHYTLPADACNTYSVAFKLLEQFEDDLHTHVHLENNILYPKALQL